METAALNVKTSPNPKGGLAFLVKAPAKLSPQTVQPGENAPFADMLGEKISQAALWGSTSDSTTAAPGKKRPLPAATKGLALNGNSEPAPLAESAGKKSLFPADMVEPTEEAKTAIHLVKAMMEQALTIPVAGESVPHADPSPTENATRQIAPPYGPDTALFAQADGTLQMKNDGPATNGVPAKNPTTVAAAVSVASANPVSHKNLTTVADAAPVASADPVSHKNLTDASPAATAAPASHEVRPLSNRRADHRSPLEGDGRRTEQGFTPRPDETLQMKNDGPATDGAPAKNPTNVADAAPVASANPVSHKNPTNVADAAPVASADPVSHKNLTDAPPAAPATPASHEVRPPSDRRADHRSPLEEAGRRTEQVFTPRPNGTLQMKNDGPATDGAPAKNPTNVAAAAPVASADPVSHKNLTDAPPAAPATPASHEVRPLSDRRADHRSPLEGAGRRTEQVFTPRPDGTLQMKNDGPATKGAPSDVRQAGPSRHDHGKRAVESIAAASQKPVSVAGNGDAMIGQAAPERMTPGESPDKILPIRDAVTETPGPARNHQESRNTISNHQTKLPERDMFPFRMEMPNVVSPQETRPLAGAGSTGIDMQSVIDQLLEARQSAGSDVGRIRIMLNPPNLGSVDLDIVVRGERVDVVMTAESTTVQQALQSRGDDIRIALQRQDLKIEGFQVLLQDNGTSQQQTHSGEMYRQNREPRESFSANADLPPAFPVFSTDAGVNSAAGRISIFA